MKASVNSISKPPQNKFELTQQSEKVPDSWIRDFFSYELRVMNEELRFGFKLLPDLLCSITEYS